MRFESLSDGACFQWSLLSTTGDPLSDGACSTLEADAICEGNGAVYCMAYVKVIHTMWACKTLPYLRWHVVHFPMEFAPLSFVLPGAVTIQRLCRRVSPEHAFVSRDVFEAEAHEKHEEATKINDLWVSRSLYGRSGITKYLKIFRSFWEFFEKLRHIHEHKDVWLTVLCKTGVVFSVMFGPRKWGHAEEYTQKLLLKQSWKIKKDATKLNALQVNRRLEQESRKAIPIFKPTRTLWSRIVA